MDENKLNGNDNRLNQDIKKNTQGNEVDDFSDLSSLVADSLGEINERYDEDITKTPEPTQEGVVSGPTDGALPDQFEPKETEASSGPEGFGTMNVEVEDENAQLIGQDVDAQVENREVFQSEPRQKAEATIISTAEEKADRYKDTSIRDEIKEKELIVTPRKKKAVRTYRDFAIENAKTTGGSLANMIMAEREKDSEKKRKSATNPKNVAISILSILFVVLGIGGVVLTYFAVTSKQESIREANSIIVTPNPQITAEFSKEIYEPDINFRKLTSGFENDFESTATPIGSIKQVYFTTSSGESLKYLVNTKKFLDVLNTRTPSSLIRTFSEDFTLGIYSTLENSQFLMFMVGSYPTAVDGMLDWEEEIVLDLDPVLKITQAEEVRKRFFEDIILFNKDTRAILDNEGNIAFAYSFIDRQTLVIFKDKNTLKEVVSRLQNTIKR